MEAQNCKIVEFQDWILSRYEYLGTAPAFCSGLNWLHFRHHVLANVRLALCFLTNEVRVWVPDRALCAAASPSATHEIEMILSELGESVTVIDTVETH